MKAKITLLSTLLAATCWLSACTGGDPEPGTDPLLRFRADGGGTFEVPANPSAATLLFKGTLNQNTGLLVYEVTYSGIDPIAGHIHGGAPGTNGPILIPFASPPRLPVKGQATLSASRADSLIKGLMYVNFHTRQYPGGEIRGNIHQVD